MDHKIVFNTIILSYLRYMLTVLHLCNNIELKKLQILQNGYICYFGV